MIKFFRENLMNCIVLATCAMTVLGVCACDTQTKSDIQTSASAIASPTNTYEIDKDQNDNVEHVATATPDGTYTGSPSASPLISDPLNTAEQSSASPTPTNNPLYDEIAMSFFGGTWEATSGMVYIFNEKDRSVTLKDRATDEVLLIGVYEARTIDFTEYELSMTFNGETDEYIAWRYSDTGSVDLRAKGSSKSYDNLWRAE